MKLPNEWFVVVYNTDGGEVILRGRMHLDAVRQAAQHPMLVELQWELKGDSKGMPTEVESDVIDNVMNIVCDAVERSGKGVLTAIHTGACRVRYLFYATSIDEFMAQIDALLQRLQALPLTIGVKPDASWQEYTHMIAQYAMQ